MLKRIKYRLIFVVFGSLFLSVHAQQLEANQSEQLALSASEADSMPALKKKWVNSINLEIGGASVIYALGYEHVIFKSQQLYLSTSIGIEVLPYNSAISNIASPISINGIVGKRKIRLYSSIGALNVLTTEPKPSSMADRRRVRQKDPAYMGTAFIPVYRSFPYIGLGVQANFKKCFLRLYANGFYYYSLQTGTFTYYNTLVPWGGLTVGYYLNTKSK